MNLACKHQRNEGHGIREHPLDPAVCSSPASEAVSTCECNMSKWMDKYPTAYVEYAGRHFYQGAYIAGLLCSWWFYQITGATASVLLKPVKIAVVSESAVEYCVRGVRDNLIALLSPLFVIMICRFPLLPSLYSHLHYSQSCGSLPVSSTEIFLGCNSNLYSH